VAALCRTAGKAAATLEAMDGLLAEASSAAGGKPSKQGKRVTPM
jgi:hypothetical protein